MTDMIEMMQKIATMPFPWNLWVGILLTVQMIGAMIYIKQREGQLVMAAMMMAAIAMTVIYSHYGFVRLLGLGHILFWTPLVIWLIKVVRRGDAGGRFLQWLKAVIVLDCLSLVLDYADVVRWYLYDRG